MTAQTILPANSVTASGYDVANSCRFDGSSSYMQKTLGAPTSAKKATFSLWFKTSDTIAGNGGRCLMSWGDDAGAIYVNETNDGQWEINLDNSDGLYKGTAGGQLSRDPAAWSHLCLIIDTTNDTANDRFQFFLNNVRVVFSANNNNNPDEDYDVAGLADGQVIAVGRRHSTTSLYYSGYMAEVCFIDGLSLGPDSFGEFDSDSGIWKPIKVSGLTFGNNGFYLEFKDGSNLGDELKGTQTADWSETNLAATDQSTDTCTNNFATLNPLITGANFVFSDNNLVIAQSATNWDSAYSTMGVTSGKWYMEFKGKVGAYFDVGVTDIINAAGNVSQNSGCVAYKSNGEFARAGAVGDGLPSSITDPASSSYGVNDIIGIALDVDNEAVYFSKNGTYEVNSDPESGASKTGAVTLPNSNSLYFFAVAAYKGSAASGTAQVNFGGGSVDAISSGNADADGHGNFEFAVPSGYFALCTKNLAEYG